MQLKKIEPFPSSLNTLPQWAQEVLWALLILAVLLWTSWFTQEAHRYVHALFPLVLFLTLLAFFNRAGALAMTLSLIGLLHVINQRKMQATSEPLLAIDLFEWKQAAALTSYIDWRLLFASLQLIIVFASALFLLRSRLKLRWRAVLLMPLLFLIVLQTQWLRQISVPVKNFMREELALYHVIWDMPGNLNLNGLLGHLWFTATVMPVPERSTAPIPFYQQAPMAMLPAGAPVKSEQPTDIFLILCEACWGPEGRLQDTPLNVLLKKGFQASTAYSPVFGGMTANAEFEMLTGLPSRGLPGVVYMNYGKAFRDQTASLPRELAQQGFETYALHNYTRQFWKRDMVYPKLGFQHLAFIDEMPWDGKRWPDDQLLFDAALEQVHQKTMASRFFFLITVHTHGSYEEQQDRGHGDYARRLQRSVNQMAQFVERVNASARLQQRRTLFIVFGDHKPSLLKWFHDEGVLDANLFSRKGATTEDFQFVPEFTPEQRRQLQSVPLLMASNDAHLPIRQWVGQLQRRPFYCVPALLAQHLLEQPSQFFSAVSGLCNSEKLNEMLFTKKVFGANYFTEAVYADRLFD